MLISLLNCSPNDKLFLAGSSLGVAAKMAPKPFAFLFFGGAVSPEEVAESETEGLTGSHSAFDFTGMDDFSLQFKFCQLSVSNVSSFESRVQDRALVKKLRNDSRFVACAEIPGYY